MLKLDANNKTILYSANAVELLTTQLIMNDVCPENHE
jgi:hypothetical protein